MESFALYMAAPDEQSLSELDRKFLWHPFTQMRDWMRADPVVIVEGKGARLWDDKGNEYLDGNSSIWTNLHGHQNRRINNAIKGQLKKIAHSSALGLANEPASLLGEKLVNAANRGAAENGLARVFYSDDGSTAMEVALKLSYEYWRRNGNPTPRFFSLDGAYHGDTVGAVSLGHIDLFHKAYGGLLFQTEKVMAPYCYRCPFNQAQPERADARTYRKCNWECVGKVEEQLETARKERIPISGMVVEPLLQGAAGMIPQPEGWLGRVGDIVAGNNAHLIADEVMTGFARAANPAIENGGLFAFQQEGVRPDFVALAKGLTGGCLPMAATLATQQVFDVFLGEYEEFKTFFHGHSYTGNQLGSAAANASIELLQEQKSKEARRKLAGRMAAHIKDLWRLPQVGDIRQVGLVAGIELVRDWPARTPFELVERAGMRVCEAMSKRGVLTRPIGNVIVIMPPYCTTGRELSKMFSALHDSIEQVLGPG